MIKRMSLLTLLSALLFTGGCASMAANEYQQRLADCLSRSAFTIDSAGNLVRTAPNCSHIQPTGGNSLSTGEVVAVAGLVAGGLYIIYKLMDEKNATTTTSTSQNSPIVQPGGQRTEEWSGTYITPTWGTIQ